MSSTRRLDCHSYESTLESLGVVLGTSSEAIKACLASYNPETLPSDCSPENGLWRVIKKDVGVSVQSESACCYFHVTRTIGDFRKEEGILPLNLALGTIWSGLQSLAAGSINPIEWGIFRSSMDEGSAPGHSASLYANKVSNNPEWGPYGILVRETTFKTDELGIRDYLRKPSEIIEDILDTLRRYHNLDLFERYVQASKPCIVSFISTRLEESAIASALMYIFARDWPDFLRHANYCFDGHGLPVPAHQIIGIQYPVLQYGAD